jgi:hypothetical protein
MSSSIRSLVTATTTLALAVVLAGCGGRGGQVAHETAPFLKEAARTFGVSIEEVRPVLGTTDESALKRILDQVAKYNESGLVETCRDVKDAAGKLEDLTGVEIGDMLREVTAFASQYPRAAQLRDTITSYQLNEADLGDIYDAADAFTTVVCLDFDK